MKTVAGIYDTKVEADLAVSNLLDEGFDRSDISMLMSDKTRNRLFSSTDDEAERVAKGGAAGAAIGTALGALVAGLTAVGSIVVPGSGLLVAGPLVAILSGAGAGAVIGGLSGALIHAGFAADEANKYEEAVRHGKTVIIMHLKDEKREMVARDALGVNTTIRAA